MSAHLDDKQLQMAAEGLLDKPLLEQAREHLQGCERCRQAVANYQALFSQLNAVPLVEAPSALADAVIAAYERSTEPIANLWSDRKLLLAFALANVVLVLTILWTIGVQGPVNLLTSWAVGLKELVIAAIYMLPAVEAVWTAMSHGGIIFVLALAALLVAIVAALRQTMKFTEETS